MPIILRSMGWLAVAGAVTLAAVASAWLLTGGRVYTVQTGSMMPAFRPGDAVLVRRQIASQLHPGNVVTYRDRQQPRLIISHRFISRSMTGMLSIKGDANKRPDARVAPNQVIGQVVAVAPQLGRYLRWLRSPIGLSLAFYAPVVAVVVYEGLNASIQLRRHPYRAVHYQSR